MEFNFKPLCEEKRTLIIDTDIGPDCDDVGALVLTFRLAKKYGFTVGGIVNCTSNPYGNGAIDAIAERCGVKLHATGAFAGKGFLEDTKKFNKYLAENMVTYRSPVVEATEYYKSILENCEDNSVMLVTIGQFNTVADLLKNEKELFDRKIYAVVSMAAEYPKGREYNVFCDAASCKYFIENCSKPIFFSGFEIGKILKTGFTPEEKDDNDPVVKAYELYTDGRMKRESWDLTALQFAIEGKNGFYEISEEVGITIDDNGCNEFFAAKGTNRYYLKLVASVEDTENYLNSLLKKY